MMKEGILIVISGPSGAGKGTVCSQLRKILPNLKYSTSATTRTPRSGEKEGVNYYFLSMNQFEQMISDNKLLEYARVYDNYYGTPKEKVEEALALGEDVLLEIDIQGALQVKKRFPNGVFIFLTPPTLTELKKRIINRGTESQESLTRRLGSVQQELSYINEYEYLVINDDINKCAKEIGAIILAEKCKVKRNQHNITQIVGREI
ncbi:MAG: guanylate kinase [Bacillota bacterium]|nr:guanylate kinase [Bacillota bacterium]